MITSKSPRIDVIGIGCRFAGRASSPDEFWSLLNQKNTAICDIPADRFNTEQFLDPFGGAGKSVTFQGGWLDAVDRFDHQHFYISRREAKEMDPQQRLFLEVAHEALHDAGLSPGQARGRRIGVFVGSGIAEYQAMAFAAPSDIGSHTMSGNSLAMIANRLSYVLDLDGPSLTVDTACSASMTALALACNSLVEGSCDAAIVGGTNTMLGPSPFIGFSQARMLSPRGVCAPFDECADGFVRGEGCGVVVLKRSDADWPNPTRTYARVAGFGTNEDGHTPSLTMPDPERQETLYRETLAKFGITTDEIVYVEAHGTGTPVGDPIEASSVYRAFDGAHRRDLPIGSVKGHIGHLETAAGIAGVIKAALCIHHRRLVPTAGHRQISRAVQEAGPNLRIPTEVEALPTVADGKCASIAVCSYGFGGANGVAILAVPVDQMDNRVTTNEESVVMALSGDTEDGIAATIARFSEISASDRFEAARWSTTLLQKRRHRAVTFVRTRQPHAAALSWRGNRAAGTPPKLLFAFSGQGSQCSDMGAELAERFPAYASALRTAVDTYSVHAGRHLIRDHGLATATGLSKSDLNDVNVAMPAVVMTQIALIELLNTARIEPASVTGHSTGEMAAAWAAGVLSLDDLCALVAARARAQAAMPEGAMAALKADVSTAQALLEQTGLSMSVGVAAINTARSVTLSGAPGAIAQLLTEVGNAGLRGAQLPVRRAYHSHDAQAAAEALQHQLRLNPTANKIPFISATGDLTGTRHGLELDESYWAQNVAAPVDFLGACACASGTVGAAVEIAPQSVLSKYLEDNLSVPVVAAPSTGSSVDGLLEGLADLFLHGVNVDFSSMQPPRRFLPVPKVPWDHNTVLRSATWCAPSPTPVAEAKAEMHEVPIKPMASVNAEPSSPAPSTESDPRLSITGADFPPEGIGTVTFRKESHAFLQAHKVAGNVVMPGAGFVAMALRASGASVLSNVRFQRFLPLFRDGEPTSLAAEINAGEWSWRGAPGIVFSCTPGTAAGIMTGAQFISLPDKELGDTIDVPRVYRAMERLAGLQLNQAFRSISEACSHGASLVATLKVAEDIKREEDRRTIFIDGAFQSLAFLGAIDQRLLAPISVKTIELLEAAHWPEDIISHATLVEFGDDRIEGDVVLQARDGRCLMRISSVVLGRMDGSSATKPDLFALEWQNLDPKSASDAGDVKPRSLRVLDASADAISWRRWTLEPFTTIVSLSEVLHDTPNHVLPPEVEGALEPKSFDIVIATPRDEQAAKRWLKPRGHFVSYPDSTPLPEAPTALMFDGPVYFTGKPPFGWQGIQANDPQSAVVVVDNRGDIAAASRLLAEVSQLEVPPALIFIHECRTDGEPSPIPGFARAARNEHRNIPICSIGVSPSADKDRVAQALAEFLSGELGPDREYRLTPTGWQVPRLFPATPPPTSNVGDELRLDVLVPGQLDTLRWRPIRPDLEGLGPDEVRIRVSCVSMHFKDVMLALGLLKGFAPILGMEAGGVIEAIGAEVSQIDPRLVPGQSVVALAMTSEQGSRRDALFGSAAVVKARHVYPKPDNVDLVALAASLGVQATAWYALHEIGRLRPDETILIHSAAGGVGQAAIAAAQKIGAAVVASAGSPEKRALLAERYGLQHVICSRSPELFVSEIQRITGGRGVDAALNSLAGDGMMRTLECLSPGGRHLEIGKRDILEDAPLPLGLVKQNISFLSIHLDLLAESHPDKSRAFLNACIDRFARGDVPPIETTIFAAESVVDAFRLLGSGKHTGKVVVDLTSLGESAWAGPEPQEPSLGHAHRRRSVPLHTIPDTLFARYDSHLITGGTGGIGLAFARFLAARGAGRILLASSSGNLPARNQLQLDAIRTDYPDVQIHVIQLDVSKEAAVREFLAAEPSITGIVHAATRYGEGAASDLGDLAKQTWQVKAKAAEILDRATRDRAMRYFVMVGSLAGLHGNTRQAAYVAANAAFADIARARRAAGHCATSIELPIILGAGRLSDPRHVTELLYNIGKGFSAVPFKNCLPLLELVFAQPDSLPAALAVDSPDWASYRTMNRNPALFDHLVPRDQRDITRHERIERVRAEDTVSVIRHTDVSYSDMKNQPIYMKSSINSANEHTHQHAPRTIVDDVRTSNNIEAAVVEKIAFVLGAEADEVDLHVPLIELGVDSLAATELGNWVEQTYTVGVSQSAFLSGLTASGLIASIGESFDRKEPLPTTAAPSRPKSQHDAASPVQEWMPQQLNGKISVPRQTTIASKPVVSPALEQIPETRQYGTSDATVSIIDKLAFVLGVESDDIDLDVPLIELGVDSLAATELGTFVDRTFGVEISQTAFLSGLTAANIISQVAGTATAPTSAISMPNDTRAARTAGVTNGSEPPRSANGGDPSPPSPAVDGSINGHRVAGATSSSIPAASARPSVTDATRPVPHPAVAPQPVDVPLAPREQLRGGYTIIHVPETLDGTALDKLLSAIRATDNTIVLRRTPGAEHFCLGMNLDAAEFGSAAMANGLEQFEQLAGALNAASMPTVAVIEGACRGGGILFPSLASVVIAEEGASFGFPEIRRGGLPGLVSVYAQKRVAAGQLRSFMLTGDAFGTSDAQRLGLVDYTADSGSIEREVKRIVGRLGTIPPNLLAEANKRLPADTPSQAIIAMGGLDPMERTRERNDTPLVRVRHHAETGVVTITLADPDYSNAIDWAIADDLSRAIAAVRSLDPVRAVVVEGEGAHFCVGVNPYNFIRRTKQLPVPTAARITYDIYRAFVGLRELSVPVVAAVHGKVMGGGLAAMLNTDYRIAAADTSFNYGNLPRGVCPGLLMSHNLERAVGAQWATELYFGDFTLTAEEAENIGLVHSVAADALAAKAEAQMLASRIAGYAPMGVRETMSLMRHPIDEARLAQESVGIARCNVEGDAFAAGWKAAERRLAEPAPVVLATDRADVAPIVPTGAGRREDSGPFHDAGAEPPFTVAQTMPEPSAQTAVSREVGIHAIELYFPPHAVRQADMEDAHGVPGKYTAGLGQDEITFCGNDEDAVSMALTAVTRLVERTGIGWDQIGRLEVGTESLVDRSKSIKTHVMALFSRHGQFDIEGVDTYNACYGGTAALFNAVAWCQSEAWDGRYAIVVAVDIADLDEHQAFLNGAAAVAMLVGPDAPILLDPLRASHMMHTWDFYKPVAWENPFPLMRDGAHSIDVYMACLTGCYDTLSKKRHENLLESHDYAVFHCTSTYLCRRAFNTLIQIALPEASLRQRQQLYKEKSEPSIHLTKRIGSTYTASCFVNLLSLLMQTGEDAIGKSVLMFSYGSGAASSMYSLTVRALPVMDMDLDARLADRTFHDPATFTRIAAEYSAAYDRLDFVPTPAVVAHQGEFRLGKVSEYGVRSYYRVGAKVAQEWLQPDKLSEENATEHPRTAPVQLERLLSTGDELAALLAGTGKAVSARDGDAPAFDPVINVKKTTSPNLPQIFLLPPPAGTPFSFRDLLPFVTDTFETHSIRARGLMPGETPFATWQEMMGCYAEGIRKRLDGRPYFLFGFSFGGFTAQELGARFSTDGPDAPAGVILGDMVVPEKFTAVFPEEDLSQDDVTLLRRRLRVLVEVFGRTPDLEAQLDAALLGHREFESALRAVLPVLNDDPGVSRFFNNTGTENLVKVFKSWFHHARFVTEIDTIGRHASPMLVIRTQRTADIVQDKGRMWADYCGSLEEVIVDAYHNELIQGRVAAETAAHLLRWTSVIMRDQERLMATA